MTENNKLIAEFMGWHSKKINITSSRPKGDGIELYLKEVTEYNGRLIEESLQFHTDWNWLMEVVEKIESLGVVVEIRDNVCYIETTPIDYYSELEETKIQATYKAVVEFIKLYKQKK